MTLLDTVNYDPYSYIHNEEIGISVSLSDLEFIIDRNLLWSEKIQNVNFSLRHTIIIKKDVDLLKIQVHN